MCAQGRERRVRVQTAEAAGEEREKRERHSQIKALRLPSRAWRPWYGPLSRHVSCTALKVQRGVQSGWAFEERRERRAE